MNNEQTFGYRGDRVRENSTASVNRNIDREIRRNIQSYMAADPEAIEDRIRELEVEWDIERVLEAMASSFSLIGLALGRTRKRFLGIPLAILPFLLLHAVQGWCPPMTALRRMGFRTQREIEAEKYALKALQKLETAEPSRAPAILNVGL